MSQECWYSLHLRHTDEFYPYIRPGLKKRKKTIHSISHQPRTSYVNHCRHSRERVKKFVSFRSVKRPKRANRRILWLWKSPENSLASFVIYSQFEDSTFTAAKSNAKFQTGYLKRVPFVNWRYWVREGYLFSQKILYKRVRSWPSR